jgi:type IX secretion system PorP/SprF family membrane protein
MKSMIRSLLKGIFIAGTLLYGAELRAQDVHFSQYNSSPLLLNPALAGMNNCDYRVYANFRVQWPTVASGNTYRTFAGGADMSIGKITKYNSFAGIGLSFVSDQAGALNLSNNRVDLSVAYHFMLNHKGTQQISAGLQGSFNYRTINPSNATFDSQYDPTTGTVDPNGTRENFGRTKVIYGDAGLGVVYSAMIKETSNVYFGFSLSHVNQPKISFYPSGQAASTSAGERLYMKETLHGGAAIPVGQRLTIMPNFLVLIQGPSHEFDLGCNFKIGLGNNEKTSTTAFHVGAQYRGVFDAVIINTRIDIKGFSCGLSYDINVSKLLPASHTIGAPEIALIYQGCTRKKPRPGHCPVMF